MVMQVIAEITTTHDNLLCSSTHPAGGTLGTGGWLGIPLSDINSDSSLVSFIFGF